MGYTHEKSGSVEDVGELCENGLSHYNDGDFEESNNIFERVISLLENPPKSAEPWNLKGIAYHCLGCYYDAINCYDRALRFDDQFIGIHYNKSLTLRNMGKYFEALCSLNLYTLERPDDYVAKNAEGLIFDELKEYERAVSCFDNVINATSDDIDKDSRIKDLHIKALSNKAMSLANNKKYDTAQKIINHLNDDLKQHRQSFVLDTEAFICIKKEDYKEAVKLLDQAASTSTNDKYISYHRGVAYSKLGKSRQALRNYNDAIEIDKNFAEAYNDKAAELSKLGRYDEAREALELAIKSKPGLVTAHENLIKISVRQQSSPTFWEYWKSSNAKKTAGAAIFILAAFLIIFPLMVFIIPLMSDMVEGKNFRSALSDVTSGTGTSGIESVIPITFLTGTAILAIILLSPVIRTAKMGPLEFSFLDSQRSAQPLSSTSR